MHTGCTHPARVTSASCRTVSALVALLITEASADTTGTAAVHDHLQNLALCNLTVTFVGQLPDAYACVLAIDRMVFNRNGDIEPVKMTKDGPGSLPLPRKP